MSEPIYQEKRKKQLDYIDREIIEGSKSVNYFKKAAYALGMAIGIFLLEPFLPSIGESEKGNQMIGLFTMMAFGLIGYAIAIAICFLFFRANMKFLMFLLNWFVIPTFGIWCIVQGYGIISGH